MKRRMSQSMRCWVLALSLAIVAQAVAAETSADKPPPSNCDLYPIALSLSSVSNLDTGTVLYNLRNGANTGQFGWLTWTGNRSQDALARSLSTPGNSHSYVNPYNKQDSELSPRNWVKASGSDNGKPIRQALEKLKKQEIVVPLWYQADTKAKAYRVAGFAKVQLLSYNLSGTDTLTVRYLGKADCDKGNDAPIVSAGADQVIAYPARATLNGSATDDGLPRGGTLTAEWTKISGPGEVVFSEPHAPVTQASFSDPGVYVLRLSATDSTKTATDEVTITVNYANTAPVANAQTLDTAEDVAIAVTLTGGDVDGDSLNFTVLSNPTFGTLSGTAPNLFYTPNANLSGTDTFGFSVNDGTLDSAPATVTINVAAVNDPPIAYAQSVSTDEDIPVSVAVAGNDVEGTALLYTITGQPAHGTLTGTPPNLLYTPAANYSGSDQFTFTVDDGGLSSPPATVTLTVRAVNDAPVALRDSVVLIEDGGLDVLLRGSDVEGGALTFAVVALPLHGELIGTPPALRYVPAANYNGPDSFAFKVNDGVADSAPAAVTIDVQPVNDPPVAVDETVSLDEDASLGLVIRGTDVDGDALTFSLVASPTRGVLNGTLPNVTYVPAENYYGSDSFSFKVNDGALDSAVATVTVAVRPVNDRPVAMAQQVTLAEDGFADILLAGSDIENNVLTFTVIAQPSHGVLSGTAPELRYAPGLNHHGTDEFTFRVNDGTDDSAVAVVQIVVTPVNDAPVGLGQSLSTLEDTGLNITLSGTDIDGDPVTYTLTTAPAHGILSGTPPNVTYSPNTNYAGPDTFGFVVNDGTVDSGVATVDIDVTPVNDAPVALPLSISTLEDTAASVTLSRTDVEGDELGFVITRPPVHGALSGIAPDLVYTPNFNFNGNDSFAYEVSDGSSSSGSAEVTLTVVPVNDTPVGDSQFVRAIENEITAITLTGTDVDNDVLTYTVVDGPTNGTLSGEAPNLTYVPNLTGRPETDSFTFTVSDGVVSSTLATVTIDIVYNQPPVVNAGPDRAVRSVTDTVTLTGSTSDDGLPRPANVQVSWQLKFGPGTVHFSDPTSAVTSATFSERGLYVLELSANDSQYTSSDLVEVRVDMICDANPSGAVAWWPGNYIGTDTISGNTATLQGGVNYSSGKVGGAFAFDGVDGRVRIEPHPSLDLGAGNSFTIEFWMNSSDVSRSVRLVGWHSDLDVFSEDNGINIFQSGGSLHAQIYDTNNVSHELAAFSALANDQWTHVAVTYDRTSGQGRIYVNGALRVTSNLGNFRPRTTFPLFFGHVLNDTSYYEGRLDEVTFYNRALDAQEIYEVVNANGTGKCPISGNLPPVVNAGPDVYLQAPGTVTLMGSATDDGEPAPASLRAAWTVITAPGSVSLADSSALATQASFDAAGIYVLRLTVDDAAISRSDVVEVRVASVCTVDNIPGLVAWFSGNGHTLDAISAREARLSGGTAFAMGHVASAFSFDGVNDSARVLADTALDVGAANGFSMEFWVNSADVARNARLVGYHNGLAANGTNIGVNIFQFAGNVHIQIPELGGSLREFVASGVLIANAWTHIAVTYDRTRGIARAYVNGAQRVASNIGSVRARTIGNLHLGNVPFDVNHFRGLLDEVSVYNRALDAQEVYALFSAGNVGKCPNDLNQGPVVNAGPDLYVREVGDVATLNGAVTDDGLPPGYPVSSLWSVVDGPGMVIFGNAAAPLTTATFSDPGVYVLRLSANDALVASSDLVEVRVASVCTVKDTPGLVAWWPGNGSETEVVGGNHARLAAGATYAGGKVSSAFRFDGVNDSIQVPAHPSLDVGQGSGLTLEFWVNPHDVLRFARVLGWHFGIGTASTNFGVNVYQQSSSLSAQIYDTAGLPHEMGAPNTLLSNVWTHVAVTYDRTTGQGRIFVNGALRTTTTLGVFQPRTSYTLYFGNLPSDSSFFRGMLDEVSIYNRPLDPQEVYEVYSAGAVGKCPKDENQAPLVNAGPDLTLGDVTELATLNGTLSDDGLPAGIAVRANWSKVEGPGTVIFGDPNSPGTTASFSESGIYVLKLTGDDAQVIRDDLVEVRVGVPCSTAPNGLVAWWPGNGTAQEIVGGRDGRLAGGTAFAGGRVSAAFRFDGTNDAVHVAANPALDVGLGSGLTIEFWMSPTDVTRNGRMVGWHSGFPGTATNFGVNVQMLGRTVNAQLYDVAGLPHDVTVANALTNNLWTHVAVTYDRATALGRVYINGVLRTTVSVGSYTPRTNYKLYFGNLPFDPNFFRGLLDEVSIYDRALASNEVAAVFVASAAGKCPPSSMSPMLAEEWSVAAPASSVVVDDQGRRVSMTDGSGTTTYNYDANGRVSRITRSWSAHAGAPAVETALSYEYDVLGRLAGVHSTSVNGASMRYVWNDVNQLLAVVDPHSGTTVYQYEDGQPVGYIYPDNVAGARFGVLDNVGCQDEPGASVVCDADGHRSRKTVTIGSRTVITYYIVSPLTVTGAPQLVEELTFDSADPLFVTPAVTRAYVHGLHTISHEQLKNGAWEVYFYE